MPTPITASTLSALLSTALAQKPTRPLVLPQRQDHPCQRAVSAVSRLHPAAPGGRQVEIIRAQQGAAGKLR